MRDWKSYGESPADDERCRLMRCPIFVAWRSAGLFEQREAFVVLCLHRAQALLGQTTRSKFRLLSPNPTNQTCCIARRISLDSRIATTIITAARTSLSALTGVSSIPGNTAPGKAYPLAGYLLPAITDD
ncbi:MAG: hypothetical protein FD165_456 [Gammaproteobacteria bacterium]|nr:MAG: hypothetical protein FD165_456 [Gammaproteobacteria bacterium]